jgi:uncharacterized protein
MKKTLLAFIALSVSSSALAGHFEDAYRAYLKGNYKLAFQEWSAADADGDVESTFELSVMYRDGEGVPINATKATLLTAKAAEKGFVPAQFNLANYYRTGAGTNKDLAAARRWYLTAAQTGSAEAMHSYATMLLLGEGGAVDKVGAVEWYERAILYEDKDSYYYDLIEKGILPKPDYPALFKQRRAQAEAGDAEAQFRLAYMYLRAQGTARNAAEMERWFLAAANQGHAMAQMRMGNLYKDGFFKTRDLKVANGWFRKAALQGNGFALSTLGLFYAIGGGVSKNEPLGLALLAIARMRGDPDATELRIKLALDMTDADVVTAAVIAKKCQTGGMVSCLPPV